MKHVIIGCSSAGIAAAEALRSSDAQCEITLLANEPFPYLRPRILTTLGGNPPEKLTYKKPEFFAERAISVLHSEAVSIDRGARKVLLKSGEALSYDKLCLTLGAYPFVPPVPGLDKKCVFTMTMLEDVLSLKAYIEAAGGKPKVVVMGGGLIGLEAAQALCKLADVTVIERSASLLSAILARGNDLVRDAYEALGVNLVFGDSIVEALGGESITHVRTEKGLTLEADALAVTAGVRARVQLAKDAGLECRRGIVVSSAMQTQDENIYAAGDAAELDLLPPGPSLWTRAMAQGRVAGENMAGGSALFAEEPPMNALTLGGLQVFTLGNATGGELSEWRGENESKAAALENGVLIGASRVGPPLSTTALKKEFVLGESFSF